MSEDKPSRKPKEEYYADIVSLADAKAKGTSHLTEKEAIQQIMMNLAWIIATPE